MTLTQPLLDSLRSRASALQLRDAASSVAANYRAATRARSHREFIAKLGIALEEADESHHWLEFIVACLWLPVEQAQSLTKEADELTRILNASIQTARRRGSDR